MKVKNTTPYSDVYLRRMTVWACQEVGLPVREVKHIQFRNRRDGCSGHIKLGRRKIVVSTGEGVRQEWNCERRFYIGCSKRDYVVAADRTEELLLVLAHELAHLCQYLRGVKSRRFGRPGGSERHADAIAIPVWRAFRRRRAELEAAWSRPVQERVTPVKSTLQENRASRTAQHLKTWEAKAKLARTKVQKYRRLDRYYTKQLAAKRSRG